MAVAKLSQDEIDALLTSMHENTAGDEVEDNSDHSQFDFRRPSKFAREHMRSLESAHEVFIRRFTSLYTQALRTVVTLELISSDQITYEDYTRSIPNPSVLTSFTVAPLPGTVVIEMSTQMALTLIDRILGGIGTPVPMRRPTDLERDLVLFLMEHTARALTDALAPLEEIKTVITGVEFNPQFVQAVAPSEMVLMLTFNLGLQGTQRTEGMLTICYPFSTLAPAMGRLESHAWHAQQSGRDDSEAEEDEEAFAPALFDVNVPLSVQLSPTEVPAADIACLLPGHVIRLAHRVDDPAIAVVGGSQVLSARIGRSGKRLAVQVLDGAQA